MLKKQSRQHAVIGGTGFIPIEDGLVLAYTSSERKVDTTRDESFVLCESSPVSQKWLNSPQFRWFCESCGVPDIVERRVDGHTVSVLLIRLPFGISSPSELAAELRRISDKCNLRAEWSISNPGAGHLVWEGSGTTQHMLEGHVGRFRNTGSKPSRTRNVTGNPSREEIDRAEADLNGVTPLKRGLESDDAYQRRSERHERDRYRRSNFDD